MKRLYLLLSALFLFNAHLFVPVALSQTLHAIIVADTNDPSAILRRGIMKTKNDFETELQIISTQTGLILNKQVFAGNQFTYSNLMRSVELLDPGQDDVVFFYYIGHGILKPEIDNKWPQLILYEVSSGAQTRFVSFKAITDMLQRKNQRLLIAMAEACNSTGGRTEHFADEILGMASLSFSTREAERLKDLYLRSEGTVISSSSEPGQVSVVSSPDGGYFGQTFLEVHKELTSLPVSADWNTLLEKVKLRTTSLSNLRKPDRPQIPQYSVHVRGISRPNIEWQNQIASQKNVFAQQPKDFNYQSNYFHHYPFVVAKIVFFRTNKVYFLMSDNYITEYHPFYGLRIVGYRSMPSQPQFFQWDIISHYSPYNFLRWGVDYYGRIMEWHPRFGWQMMGIVYY
jgi:hypothetical protein